MGQRIFKVNGDYGILDTWFIEHDVQCVMLVCGQSIKRQKINNYLHDASIRLGVKIIRFSDFQPNPLYENVRAGVKSFREEACDAIFAVGGGSAMDVAKCIKLYSSLPGDGVNGSWLEEKIATNDIPFLAMPTTSGTGSEATGFAVLYYDGEKQSVADSSCIPDTVLMDSDVLRTVPEYQKKATMMDALCHAIESFWSVNSTDESRAYSKAALQGILEHMDAYLDNAIKGNAGMLEAANMAGKAINIAQTTAGHAMCYKITGLFGCAHGHAAALCDRVLFSWMINNTDRCVDPRGVNYLCAVFQEIAETMGCNSPTEAANKLDRIIDRLALEIPVATSEQFEVLKKSVNPVRLKNHPIALNSNVIEELYHKILNGEEK